MKLAISILALGVVATSSGCMHRHVIAFADNPKTNLVTIEVAETKNYYVTSTAEHRFGVCADTGDELVCKRSCGGATGIACPSGALTLISQSTNVR